MVPNCNRIFWENVWISKVELVSKFRLAYVSWDVVKFFSAHDFKGPIFRFFFWACTKIGTAWTKKVAAWWGPYQNLTNLDVFWFQNITNLDSFMFRSIVLFIFHSLVIDHHWVTLSISRPICQSIDQSISQTYSQPICRPIFFKNLTIIACQLNLPDSL